MAVIQQEKQTGLLTFLDYLAEGVIDRSYEILDGRRIYMRARNVDISAVQKICLGSYISMRK